MQLKIDGKKVFFTSMGSGKVLLILPGWMHDHTSWLTIQHQLSLNSQVLVLDFPGFGESENDKNIKDLSGYSRFLKKVIEELNFKSLTLLGHSFGGSVAIKTLSLYPNLPVSKLILVDSARVKRAYLKQLFGLIVAKSGKSIMSLPVLNIFKSSARRFLYGALKEEDYLTAGPLQAVFSRIVKEHLDGLLDKIHLPTLIIWGEKDKATPLSHAYILKDKIKNSTLNIIKNAGHWPYLEQPEEFCKIVNGFLYEK